MKNRKGLVWRLFAIVLIIFLGGWFLGCLMNTLLILSPRWFSPLFCPPESTATIGFAPDQPNQNELTLMCQDRNGQIVLAFSDIESQALQRKYFYRSSSIIMIILVAGWLGISYIRRKKKKQSSL